MRTWEKLRGGKAVAIRWDKPIWVAGVEKPTHVRHYPEGILMLYGTGTVVIELVDLPIVVRMPCTLKPASWFWGIQTPRRKELSMALKKIVKTAGERTASGPGISDGGDFPTLIEYLTATQYPDGSKRETASLIIVADVGGWRGCLSDKDNGRSLWKAGDSVLGLLMALEQAAAEDDPAAWRQQGGTYGKGKKKS
ncbi:MAG: hypothetical protein H5T33_08025 [Candidatus Methanosuratus sp.]|nr:hypothetical protein [Candidatus Methanosuratincola sp.]